MNGPLTRCWPLTTIPSACASLGARKAETGEEVAMNRVRHPVEVVPELVWIQIDYVLLSRETSSQKIMK